MNKLIGVSAIAFIFALPQVCFSNPQRSDEMNRSLERGLQSSNGFLKQVAEQELSVRQQIAQENQNALDHLRLRIANPLDTDDLRRQTLESATLAQEAVSSFARAAKESSDFPGKTLTYSSLKLECLVPEVKGFLERNFDHLMEGSVIPSGYQWDPLHVAELDNLSQETMNGHLRTSVWAASLDQIAFKASPLHSLYNHQVSPQVYKVPVHEDDISLLENTLYDRPEGGIPAVQSYGVYAWGGLRNNPFYPQKKPLGQQDCCSFIQDSLTVYTQDIPPSDYSTADLRKCYLKLRGAGGNSNPVLDYLCSHLTFVPLLSERGDKDLSNVEPGDILLYRGGEDVHPDGGLGRNGHVSVVTGFWENNPIVLEYNRDREGRGMDGFGCSVKDLNAQLGKHAVLRPTPSKA